MATTLGWSTTLNSPDGPTSRRCESASSLVLVAEDHDDTRSMLRTLLEMRGMQMIEARDGETAVALAVKEQPDLILMDGGLPLMDGITATRQMREMDVLRKVPIIFLSGHARADFQREAFAAGCDAFLIKPIDLEELDRVLKTHLKNSGEV